MSAERGLESAARWYDGFYAIAATGLRTSRHSAEHLNVARFARPSRMGCGRSAAPADGHRACARWRCLRCWSGGVGVATL